MDEMICTKETTVFLHKRWPFLGLSFPLHDGTWWFQEGIRLTTVLNWPKKSSQAFCESVHVFVRVSFSSLKAFSEIFKVDPSYRQHNIIRKDICGIKCNDFIISGTLLWCSERYLRFIDNCSMIFNMKLG